MKRTLTFFMLLVLLAVSTTAMAAVKSSRNVIENEVLVETDNAIQSITEDSTIYAKCNVEKYYYFKGKKPGAKPEKHALLGISIRSHNPLYVRGIKLGIEQKQSAYQKFMMKKPQAIPTTITYTFHELKNEKFDSNEKVYYIIASLPTSAWDATGNYTVKDILKKYKSYTIDFDIMDSTGKSIAGKYVVNEDMAKEFSYVINHDIYKDPAWMNKIPSFY